MHFGFGQNVNVGGFHMEDRDEGDIHEDNGLHRGQMHGSGALIMRDDNHREGLRHWGTGSMMSADAQANIQASMTSRFTEMIKRLVVGFVQMTKRICGSASTDAATVSACIASAKTNFKTDIDAAIDAVFGQ